MTGFAPGLGHEALAHLGAAHEYVRVETAQTRLTVYELLLRLVRDQQVGTEIRRQDSECAFMTPLLPMCQHERDPHNLMCWFEILQTVLSDYGPPASAVEEMFKTFSVYFPISLKTPTASGANAVSIDDLKKALRECFAAHHSLAQLTLPYLVDKLGHQPGDPLTASVKLDILHTLKAWVSSYAEPRTSVAPFAGKIWDALKYEARNGELDTMTDRGPTEKVGTERPVPPILGAALSVLGAVADRLAANDATEGWDTGQPLSEYLDMVIRD